MSKRKGVSADEKRTRLLELFREKQEFFQLKELEKIAPKEKGITVQSVKDVLQSLVDDDLVDSEKIGTSIYYWSYPNKSVNAKRRRTEGLAARLREGLHGLEEARAETQRAREGREPTEERAALLGEWAEVRARHEAAVRRLQEHDVDNPERFLAMRSQTQVAKEAVNRWTDNIFTMKSWCKNKFAIEESVLDTQFEIDPEMDYVD
ncbi:meiotic nuclear division protein 1 homolog [Bacillus rossius redtenbacheri]|uniref:meiotic nuclear division protein 1 homolog n=1 Tax=Bacillus rossius redtenbacheri TaxID=93214 RepID=UPI002FDDC34A